MPNLRTDAVNGANTFLVTFDGSDVDLETALAALLALGGGAGATSLDGLTDVTITTPTASQILQHNGSAWVNAAVPSPTAHATSHKSGGSDAVKLDELAAPTDVTTLNATASAHGLLPKLSGNAAEYLNGTGAFTTPEGSATTLDGLTDVTITTPSSGQLLQWNGSAWVNATVSGTGDVTAASAFVTDNRLIRSDGTGKGVQASGITIDDTNNVSGVGTLASGAITSTGQVQGTAFKATATSNQLVLGTTNLGTITWSLTGARTLTLPDATDTLVGKATTDTLTNKTIPAASNTIVPNVAVTTNAIVTLVLGQSLTMRPSAGSTSVTLPAAPAAGGWCSVMNKSGASRNVLRAGSDTITLTDGTTGQTQAAVADGELAVFICAAGETIWEQQ